MGVQGESLNFLKISGSTFSNPLRTKACSGEGICMDGCRWSMYDTYGKVRCRFSASGPHRFSLASPRWISSAKNFGNGFKSMSKLNKASQFIATIQRGDQAPFGSRIDNEPHDGEERYSWQGCE